ncbi:MAG: hypothetical protein ACK5YI_15365 [Rhodospirillales bacterium]
MFLDDDNAGRTAFDAAKKDMVLNNADVNFSSCPGLIESELEDLYKAEVYDAIIVNECGIALYSPPAMGKKKFSDRLRHHLKTRGKPSEESDVMAVKIKIAHSAAQLGLDAVIPGRIGPLEALAAQILAKMQ